MKTYRQPGGLYILFFSELWERFGFYAVQALLVLYLTNSLGLSDIRAYNLSSAFSGLLYASPVIGGLLADRILGFQRSILIGFGVYIVGYFLLIFHSQYAFYISLSLLVAGNGFFKANISSLLGTLYTDKDPRRDSGFTIFYMGINIGGFLSPIITAIIQRHYGYHVAFASCGVGLLIGLVIFLLGRRRLLQHHGIKPHGQVAKTEKQLNAQRLSVYIFTLVAIIIICFVLPFPDIIDWALGIFSLGSILFILYESIKLKTRLGKTKMWSLLILIVFSVLFWAYYMQLFYSVALFTERNVNRHFGHWVIPTAMFAGINNIVLIVLSPFFAIFWTALEKRRKNFSYGTKFAISMIFMALCFYSLVLGATAAGKGSLVGLGWVFLSMVFRELGEIFISPIGLAAVTKLSPVKLTGMMMGIWFLALSAGLIFAGKLADTTAIPYTVASKAGSLAIYSHHFLVFGTTSLIIGLIFFLFVPYLKRMTGENVSLTEEH